MPTVAIVGAGLIGRSWANVFARAGWNVAVWDPVPAVRRDVAALIAQSLYELEPLGLVKDAAAAADRVRVAGSLGDALAACDFVQESGPEVLEAKRAVFAELDAAAAPGVVLASSTSAIVASKFTESLEGRARCLVAHPVNPPHLVPVVELCGAPWTSQAAKARARQVFQDVGQIPIDVRREIDGFVLNRLQAALLSEAFRLVQDGVVSPEDLDHTVADGLRLRWSFMGPFETIELNAPEGMADYCRRYGSLFQRYLRDQPPASTWEEPGWQKAAAAWGRSPTAGEVTAKSLWRNRRLAALAAHKRKEKGPGD